MNGTPSQAPRVPDEPPDARPVAAPLGDRPGRGHVSSMTRLIVPALALLALAAPAAAQSWPPAGVDPHRYQADQHRQEMQRLRARADQREAFARQFELETRLNRLEIEAARQSNPIQPPAERRLRSPSEERALREAAAERRRAATADVTQIDAWLDRSPR